MPIGSIPRLADSSTTYGIWRNSQTIVAGEGSLGALAGEIERRDASRVFLFTTSSLVREQNLLEQVRRLIGDRKVGDFSQCRPHTPRTVILEAAALVRDTRPDLFVSFGGSTVTDTAKAVSFALANDLDSTAAFDDPGLGREGSDSRGTRPLIPQIAVPTTLSGAEYSAFAGITDQVTQVKRIYTQPGLAPTAVLLDVAVTHATPQRLWCSTGVKCLSDSLELMCSPTSHPFVQILTKQAVKLFCRYLPGSFVPEADAADRARAYCQHATWTSAYSLANSTSKLGIGVAVRHQLGAMGVGHGEATCVMFPYLLAFNWPALGEVRADIAEAIGLDVRDSENLCDSESAVLEEVRGFLDTMGLPTRLRDVGVTEEDIPGLAQRMVEDPGAAANPRDVNARDIERLLQGAL